MATIASDLATLVDNEYDRLNQKKQNVDVALQGKNRASFLNENYRERFSIYVNLVIILLVSLVLLFMSFSLSNYYPDSSFIFNIVSLIIIGLALLFSYYNVQTLYLRDNIYFDELALAPPDSSGNISYTVDSSNVLLPNMYLGAKYCDNDQNIFYDKSSGLCEKKENIDPDNLVTADSYYLWESTMFDNEDLANQGYNNGNVNQTVRAAFTTMDLAYNTGDLMTNNENKGKNETNPFEKSEFSDYTVYN